MGLCRSVCHRSALLQHEHVDSVSGKSVDDELLTLLVRPNRPQTFQVTTPRIEATSSPYGCSIDIPRVWHLLMCTEDESTTQAPGSDHDSGLSIPCAERRRYRSGLPSPSAG